MSHTTSSAPQRFAAPASLDADLSSDDDAGMPLEVQDDNLHELFEAWSRWSRTRRYFAPAPNTGTILGKLSGKSRPFTGEPDAPCNADLAALHLAILGQPRDALDTQVFHAYYGDRVAHIKRSAEALSISRTHFYRLLKAFCVRVKAASQDIAGYNRAARDALPNRPENSI